MRSKVLRTLKAAIAFSLVFSLSVPAFAASEKEQAQQTLAALQQQKAALQNRLADLQANKADTESYIKELDAELETVYAEIDRLAGELEATQAELEVTKAELEVAKAKEAEQYAALKARIKAMYENGDTSMMEIFMKADDISTILNATEYISKISDYDNQLLTDLNETRKEIERIEAKLEEQKAQLETLKAQEESKQEELEMIMDAKQAELDSLNISINEAADDIYNTQAEIDTTNQILAAIAAEEKRQAEEAERQRQLELQRQQELANQQAQQNQQTQDGSGTSDQGTSADNTQTQAPAAPSTDTSSGSGSGSSSGSVSLSWPCPSSSYVSSGYGGRTSPTAGASSNHRGIDIGASSGAAITASASGTVTSSSYSSARGYYVVISHGNGISTLYQHCSAVYVSAGQSVNQGDTIAAVGSTGYSTGPHLHFEVLVNGVNQNPLNYVG